MPPLLLSSSSSSSSVYELNLIIFRGMSCVGIKSEIPFEEMTRDASKVGKFNLFGEYEGRQK